jgi:hypothetical protein
MAFLINKVPPKISPVAAHGFTFRQLRSTCVRTFGGNSGPAGGGAAAVQRWSPPPNQLKDLADRQKPAFRGLFVPLLLSVLLKLGRPQLTPV